MGVLTLPSLKIGDLELDLPIIQGGMGVRISASRLASAVSNEGGLGVVASVGTGEEWPDRSLDFATRSYRSLRELLREAKSLTPNPIAVNIMCALTNYESLVTASVEEDVAAIISGAGLPLKLPAFVKNNRIKLIPIVSSGRAADLICRVWSKRYARLPDAFVVEGSLAGGHIGMSMAEVENTQEHNLEMLLKDVLNVSQKYFDATGTKMPVIAAGGIFDGRDIAKFLRLGASGVQMATRFVCTDECDAAYPYKEAYLKCQKKDIVMIESPVGLPLRVIRNPFVDRVLSGDKVDFKCEYKCLSTCDPRVTNYCIADALVNAYRGNMDQGFATCGANAYRIERIVSVHELVQELVHDTIQNLATTG